jgi:hypothetical protein
MHVSNKTLPGFKVLWLSKKISQAGAVDSLYQRVAEFQSSKIEVRERSLTDFLSRLWKLNDVIKLSFDQPQLFTNIRDNSVLAVE